MQDILSIQLKGIHFSGPYGYYPAEQEMGQEWILDVCIQLAPDRPIHDLADTLNYEQVYDWICEVMNKPATLLETRVQEIANTLSEKLLFVKQIEIILTKPFPLLGGEIEKAVVKLVRTY
ncbi:MAG: dihydroneopterin aldolase [Thermoflavifilum sp.]|nr:dihydroneopterin aldolase [Thermoflavifilum sp.]